LDHSNDFEFGSKRYVPSSHLYLGWRETGVVEEERGAQNGREGEGRTRGRELRVLLFVFYVVVLGFTLLFLFRSFLHIAYV